MKLEELERTSSEVSQLTQEDFKEFLNATGEKQWQILLLHAKKNKKIIQIRRLKTMEQYNDKTCEKISKQFDEFCHTKGITAKFKVAFTNLVENAKEQKKVDKAHFEEVKRQSAEANPEFTEFLHTKGFKAKVRLVIANLKKGCQEASQKSKKNIKIHNDMYQTTSGYNEKMKDASEYSAEELTRAFNDFLKEKGLDEQYAVEVIDENDD